MSDLVNIVVYGSAGRMGQAIARAILESTQARLSCALVRPGSGLADEPLDRVFGALPRDVDFSTSLDPDMPCDVLVDFSGPVAFDAALALAVERRSGFVSGTTGLREEQFASMHNAARTIPVLWAANFSLGVAMLVRCARRVANALPDWDCDIVEMHHADKRDAPSGTALTLGETIATARGARPHYASLRAGDIVGEHSVQFTGAGERLELIHRATNRDIFARGALEAAARIAGRGPGRYALGELLLG